MLSPRQLVLYKALRVIARHLALVLATAGIVWGVCSGYLLRQTPQVIATDDAFKGAAQGWITSADYLSDTRQFTLRTPNNQEFRTFPFNRSDALLAALQSSANTTVTIRQSDVLDRYPRELPAVLLTLVLIASCIIDTRLRLDRGIERRLQRDAAALAALQIAKEVTCASERDKQVVVWHEAGHALVGELLPIDEFVLNITTLGKADGSSGSVQFTQSKNGLLTLEEWRCQLTRLVAGRAAERLYFEEQHGQSQTVTQGSANDLTKAVELAQLLLHNGYDEQFSLAPPSAQLESRVSKIIDDCELEALSILEGHRKEFDMLVFSLQAEPEMTRTQFLRSISQLD